MAEQAYHRLHRGLYTVNGIYYFRYQIDKKIYRCSLRTRDRKEALKRKDLIDPRSRSRSAREDAMVDRILWNQIYDLPDEYQLIDLKDLLEMCKKMHIGIKSRTKKKGFPVSKMITLSQLYGLAQTSNCRCAVSGLPFSMAKLDKWRAPPFKPSIDRIDSTQGYERHNVRLVCYAANLAMSEYGFEVLELIATGIAREDKLSEFEQMNLL